MAVEKTSLQKAKHPLNTSGDTVLHAIYVKLKFADFFYDNFTIACHKF